MMERDPYLGRLVTGRIASGIVRVGDRVHGLRWHDNVCKPVEEGKVRYSLVLVIFVTSRDIELIMNLYVYQRLSYLFVYRS